MSPIYRNVVPDGLCLACSIRQPLETCYIIEMVFFMHVQLCISRLLNSQNVTGFGKRCIVHTSDFEYLEVYKNHNEWYTELKFLGKIEE